MQNSCANQSGEALSFSSPEAEEELICGAAAAAAAARSRNLRQLLKLKSASQLEDDMPQPEFLLLLHAVSCGQAQSAESADESPICQVAYLIYDVQRKKVLALAQHPVRPLLPPGLPAAGADAFEGVVETTLEDGRAAVSAECTAATGITDESLDSAATLADCLLELDRALLLANAHPDETGRDLHLVTDGQATLRLLLHPEASAKGIRLPGYFYAFHDLRKEFARARRSRQSQPTMEEMLAELGLHQEPRQKQTVESEVAESQLTGFSAEQCLAMSRIIGCLLADGHKFHQAESIAREYRPALVRKTDPVGPETVVRLRGLPWQAGDVEVACSFFSGLNVSPGGVALVLSRAGGRRNGEALVRFESAEHRDLALLRHRRHLGRRYIEVFKAGARDFLTVAAAVNAEAEAFLSQLDGSGQQLLRMRGLPYSVTAEQVLDFFAKSACPVQFGQAGLLFAQRPDGRATGDAFALFASSEVAERALERGHRQHIGSRYVELFKSTPAELNQVLGGFKNNQQQQQQPQKQQQQQPTLPSLPPHPQLQWSQRHLLRIGGMPAEATVADILGFLEQHSAGIAYQGVHQVLNHLGRPTGEAVIEMTSDRAAQLACEAKDGRQFWLFDGRTTAGVFVDVQRCPTLPATAEVPPPPPPLTHFLPPTPLGSHPTALLPQFPPIMSLAQCQSPFLIPFLAAFPAHAVVPATVTAPAQQVVLKSDANGGTRLASQTVLAI